MAKDTTPQTPGNGHAAEDTEALQARLQAVEKERDEYLELAKSGRAEFENYQKRARGEQERERKYAHGALAADLLPTLDNLDRALEAARKAGDNGPLVQGVALVQTQLLDALRRHGITRIEAEGQPFDPNVHQAVMQVPAPDRPPMTVVQVLEQGYMIHDRVLRPARVAVAAPPQPK